MLRLPASEVARLLASPTAVDDLGGPEGGLVAVDGDEPLPVPPLLPLVVARVGSVDAGADPAGADVAVDDASLALVSDTVQASPQAATALAVLLRGSSARGVADGLHAESAVYAALQAGAEHRRWLAGRTPRPGPVDGSERLLVERDGARLVLTLARPARRNALDAAMRDALASALAVAVEDPSVRVELRGEGPGFCSGGDLDEFGSASDPASAHLVRMSRNLGWLLHLVRDRTTAFVHGPCRGSGVELAAFARRVVAEEATTFGLPEVGMGLIPGAGGTVSLVGRIGAPRTLWLALTQRPIDTATATAWGLVDQVGST